MQGVVEGVADEGKSTRSVHVCGGDCTVHIVCIYARTTRQLVWQNLSIMDTVSVGLLPTKAQWHFWNN